MLKCFKYIFQLYCFIHNYYIVTLDYYLKYDYYNYITTQNKLPKENIYFYYSYDYIRRY